MKIPIAKNNVDPNTHQLISIYVTNERTKSPAQPVRGPGNIGSILPIIPPMIKMTPMIINNMSIACCCEFCFS